jgi:hypothetical protein
MYAALKHCDEIPKDPSGIPGRRGVAALKNTAPDAQKR